MSNFPLVLQEQKSNTSQLILCPATLDGLACATILTRALPNVDYQLFCAEDLVYTLFDYPALKEAPNTRELFFAGFPLPDPQLDRILSVLKQTKAAKVQWYSHHYWSSQGVNALQEAGVELIVDSTADTTAEILIRHLSIEDSLSRSSASMAVLGYCQTGNLADWPYVLLAIKEEVYEMRHAFTPLFEGRVDGAAPELVEAGKAVYEDLKDHVESSAQYRISAGDLKIAVIGLPMTFRNHYKLISQLVEEKLGCQMVIMFFDALQQILIMGGKLTRNVPSFLELMEKLENKMDHPIRIFDKNILLIGPSKDLTVMLNDTIEAMKKVSES